MAEGPEYHFSLPNRTYSFSNEWVVGQFLEWITSTWFRFNSFVTWIVILVIIVVFDKQQTVGLFEKLGMIIVSPIAAVLFYFINSTFLFIGSFIPVMNWILAVVRMLYHVIFCRLIAQKAPSIDLPLVFRNGR